MKVLWLQPEGLQCSPSQEGVECVRYCFSRQSRFYCSQLAPGKIAPEPPPPQSEWLSGAKVGQRPLNRIAFSRTHSHVYSKTQNGLCVARTRIYNEVYHMCVRVPFSDLSSPAKSCACCSFSWPERAPCKFIAKKDNKFGLWIPPCAPGQEESRQRAPQPSVPNLITILLNS